MSSEPQLASHHRPTSSGQPMASHRAEVSKSLARGSVFAFPTVLSPCPSKKAMREFSKNFVQQPKDDIQTIFPPRKKTEMKPQASAAIGLDLACNESNAFCRALGGRAIEKHKYKYKQTEKQKSTPNNKNAQTNNKKQQEATRSNKKHQATQTKQKETRQRSTTAPSDPWHPWHRGG